MKSKEKLGREFMVKKRHRLKKVISILTPNIKTYYWKTYYSLFLYPLPPIYSHKTVF